MSVEREKLIAAVVEASRSRDIAQKEFLKSPGGKESERLCRVCEQIEFRLYQAAAALAALEAK